MSLRVSLGRVAYPRCSALSSSSTGACRSYGRRPEIRDRQPGMMLLISMAIVVAFVAIVASALGWLDLEFWWELATPDRRSCCSGTGRRCGHIGQAQGALAALAALLPDEAETRRRRWRPETVSSRELRPAIVVLVRSGGRVPADGAIVDGAAEFDESMITGESRPVAEVRAIASSPGRSRPTPRSVSGSTPSATTPLSPASTDSWRQAQASRSRAQALADRARGAAVLRRRRCSGSSTFVVWTALGDMDEAVERTVTVLVIACPHALGLAIPLVIAISTAVAAQAGILVKDRLALERMRTIDAVLFDKTGTLTKGEPAVTAWRPSVCRTTELLGLAAAVEADSEHPLARAIVAAARSLGAVPSATGFKAMTGRGVEALVDGRS